MQQREIGVAVMKHVMYSMTPEQLEKWCGDASQSHDDQDGHVWLWDSVEWSGHDTDPPELYKFLLGFPETDYLIIEVAPEWNPLGDYTAGCWEDNPWTMCIYTKRGIELGFSDDAGGDDDE